MKLRKLDCKPFARAKAFDVSPSYIIGCTGRRAIILDKQLHLVQSIEGLEYVYSAKLSPDEKQLLLISMENKFYVVNMDTFQMTKVTVRAPYNNNIDGRGCWSFDGRALLIPVRKSGTGNSSLRCYHADDLQRYHDLLVDKYCLCEIHKVESKGVYILIGYDRSKNNQNYIIHFDGETFQEYPVEGSSAFVVFRCNVDPDGKAMTLYTTSGCLRYTTEGNKIDELHHPKPTAKTKSFSNAFRKMFENDEEGFAKVQELSASYGFENVIVRDDIKDYKKSSCGRYVYIASKSGFYLLDAQTDEVLAELREEYGVQNVEEVTENTIALATWNGVKLYQLDVDA